MNPPNPQESRWISKSLLHETKLPVDSFTRYFRTDALGAVVFVGGVYEMGTPDIVAEGIRFCCMNDSVFDEDTDWY